jgi:hypothetical protein
MKKAIKTDGVVMLLHFDGLEGIDFVLRESGSEREFGAKHLTDKDILRLELLSSLNEQKYL